MKLHHFLLFTLAMLALARCYLVPRFRRRLQSGEAHLTVQASALLGLLGWAQALLLILALSSGLLWIFLVTAQLFGGGTPEKISGSIHTLQQWRQSVAGFSWGWSFAALILLAVGLAFHAYRKGRIRMSQVVADLQQAEANRLVEELKAGRWQQMPPTKDMEKIAGTMHERQAALVELRRRADKGDNAALAVWSKQMEQMEGLRRIWLSLDLSRRVKVGLSPKDTVLPEPQDWWGRIQTFFFSQGLLICLGRGSRIVYLAALLLLIPSLVGVYSPQVGETLTRRVTQLDELRIKLTREEARKSWEEAKQQFGQEERDLTKEDQALVRDLAVAVEEQFASNQIFRPLLLADRTVHVVRSANVRRQILAQVATESSSSLKVYESGAAAEHEPIRKSVLAVVEEVVPTAGPKTLLGQKFQKEAESAARRSKTFLENLRRSATSFQRPAPQNKVARAFIQELFTATLGADVSPLKHSIVSLDTSLRQSLSEALSAKSDSLLAKILRGTPVGEALASVAAPDPDRPWFTEYESERFQTVLRNQASKFRPDETILANFNQRPPAIDTLPEPNAELNNVVERLEKSSRGGAAEARAVWMHSDILAEYSDFFPAHATAAEETPRGKLLADVQTRLSTEKTDLSILRKQSQSLFENSRRFGRLHGSSRVGGVLIGQEPTNTAKAALDFTNLTWVIRGGETRLVLQDRKGQASLSRRWPTPLVHQSLTYAADGRPVTVTILNAAPLFEQKILLHPALADTALGHRVLELDQFVEKYTGHGTNPVARLRSNAHELVEQCYGLYLFAWAHRISVWSPDWLANIRMPNKYRHPEILRAVVEGQLASAREQLASPAVLRLATAGLTNAHLINDPKRSPLAYETNFFDPRLVAQIVTAASGGPDLKLFANRIEAAAQELGQSEEARWRSFVWPPPIYAAVSGVRERSYGTTFEDFFPLDDRSLPILFDFILQLTFTDSSPWEFPSIKQQIHETVMAAALKNEDDRQILQDAQEFAMLQRFFRMALAGQLGADFPVEKLVSLGAEARQAAPAELYRTARWKILPGALETNAWFVMEEMLNSLTNLGISASFGDFAKSLRECRPLLGEAVVKQKELEEQRYENGDECRRAWSAFRAWQMQWIPHWSNAVTRLNASDVGLQTAANSNDAETIKLVQAIQNGLQFFVRVSDALQMQQALGVLKDQEQSYLRRKLPERLPPLAAPPEVGKGRVSL